MEQTEAEQIDMCLDMLDKIKEENNFKHSDWAVDCLDKPMRDFNQKHPFTALWINAGCCKGRKCYGLSRGMKPCEPTRMTGDTWLDVWKSINKYNEQKNCGHLFIESIKQTGDTLYVGCGS